MIFGLSSVRHSHGAVLHVQLSIHGGMVLSWWLPCWLLTLMSVSWLVYTFDFSRLVTWWATTLCLAILRPNLNSNHLQMIEYYPHSKEGNTPTQINSQILKPLFCDFLGSFTIWGSGVTTTRIPHGFTPTNTCPIKNSKGRCLGYVAFECHANFQINWESFAHRDQQKTCLEYAAPKPRKWQMSRFGSWTAFIVHQLRAHSHIWTNPKIANSIESKLDTWQNIANFNMNKRFTWNNLETIRTSVKGIKVNCSQPYYGWSIKN